MNLYRISQNINDDYDTYDSAIVAADNEEVARKIHPGRGAEQTSDRGTWCKPADVKVELIGVANAGAVAGVVLASFNAG